MNDTQVKAVLNGTANLGPPFSKCLKWGSFTLPLTKKLFAKLDPRDLLDTSVRARLMITFFTLVQVGEFTVSSLDSFDPASHIKYSDICNTVDHHNNHVTAFKLPHTKCTKDREDVYCAPQLGVVNPIARLDNQFSVNDPLANGHLFVCL